MADDKNKGIERKIPADSGKTIEKGNKPEKLNEQRNYSDIKYILKPKITSENPPPPPPKDRK